MRVRLELDLLDGDFRIVHGRDRPFAPDTHIAVIVDTHNTKEERAYKK